MERFGIHLEKAELEKISYSIYNYHKNDKFKPIWVNEDNGKSFHIIEVQGTTCIFLYDWESRCPATVYRENWFKKLPDGSYEPNFYKKSNKDIRNSNRTKTYNDKYMPQNSY